MNTLQKIKINELRKNGLGYKRISIIMGLSLSTIKSYCRRANIERGITVDGDRCLLCKSLLNHHDGKKRKKYCNDICRMKWWNSHLNKVNKKSYTTHECLQCKKIFESYANQARKYCSHQCYIIHRFGGKEHE